MSWPDGIGTSMHLEGRARDLRTPSEGGLPVVESEARLTVRAAPDRSIEAISAAPEPPGLQSLVGSRAGGRLRAALEGAVPEERDAGTPLYLLLDDLSGATLIGGFVWGRWHREELAAMRDARAATMPSMEGICIGFRPGSRALQPDGSSRWDHRVASVGPLARPDDPEGWHEIPEQPEVSMQRARRIDVWVDGGVVRIDAAFRDSATDPTEGRIAVHEYRISAEADRTSGVLTSVRADPRVLPYLECPDAAGNVHLVEGERLTDLRHVVLDRLAKTAGCTHLNDAVRAFAEVPQLLALLR